MFQILDDLYGFAILSFLFLMIFGIILDIIQERLHGPQKPWKKWGTRFAAAPFLVMTGLYLSSIPLAIAYNFGAGVKGLGIAAIFSILFLAVCIYTAWAVTTPHGYVSCSCQKE